MKILRCRRNIKKTLSLQAEKTSINQKEPVFCDFLSIAKDMKKNKNKKGS